MNTVVLTDIEKKAIEILQQSQAEMVVRGRTTDILERGSTGQVCALGATMVARKALNIPYIRAGKLR